MHPARAGFRGRRQRGLQSDYIDKSPITNDLAIITPYVVTFQCFTPELARVLAALPLPPIRSLSSPCRCSRPAPPGAGMTPARRRGPVPPLGAESAGPHGRPGRFPPGYPGGLPLHRTTRRNGRAGAGQGAVANGFEGTIAPRHVGGGYRETAAQELTWTFSKNITKKFCWA